MRNKFRRGQELSLYQAVDGSDSGPADTSHLESVDSVVRRMSQQDLADEWHRAYGRLVEVMVRVG